MVVTILPYLCLIAKRQHGHCFVIDRVSFDVGGRTWQFFARTARPPYQLGGAVAALSYKSSAR